MDSIIKLNLAICPDFVTRFLYICLDFVTNILYICPDFVTKLRLFALNLYHNLDIF